MSSAQLSEITIYPIKSTRGIDLSSSWVESLGLAFDRRFVITTKQGQFITARTEPKLCLIQANLMTTGLVLSAPGMPILKIEYRHFSEEYKPVTVWKDTIESQYCHEQYDLWFSQYLSKPCQLLYFGDQSTRYVKNHHSQVGFSDGYPLLLISQASLTELNKKLSNTVSMAQFRPNIVVDQCAPFAEDAWQHIRIGEVEFEITKPCSRCIFTTLNPITGEYHQQQEPLATLKSFRQVATGDVMFGQNLIPLNEGKISQGDSVEILKKQPRPVFINKTVKSKASKPEVAADKTATAKTTKPILHFNSWQKTVVGNNQQSILEQGEDAGLLLPYSCRGGMCGRCKIKLEDGEVRQTATDGLSDSDIANGYVLACSAIPQTDLTLTKPERKPRHET